MFWFVARLGRQSRGPGWHMYWHRQAYASRELAESVAYDNTRLPLDGPVDEAIAPYIFEASSWEDAYRQLRCAIIEDSRLLPPDEGVHGGQ